jgi:type IV pilus assembly protein PilM
MSGVFSEIASLLSIGGPSQIGLDIGASYVKVVGIKGEAQNPKIIGVGFKSTPTGCVVDGVLSDPRTLVDVIQDALKDAKISAFKGVPTTVGLRGVGVVFRRITLPLQSPEEMVNQIVLEAQQQIESDLSEWIISHQILTPADRQGQVAVMLVGAKKQVVNDYLQVLEMVGLKPNIFDCDIFSIANTLEQTHINTSQETILCLDIGRDTSKFHLLQGGIPTIVRSFQGGGIHLTESIAKVMGTDFDTAEKHKISASRNENPPPECQTAIATYNTELIAEMKQTMEFFANSNSDVKIDSLDRILLSGGGAKTWGLAEAISAQFNTQVEFTDPFKKAAVSEKVATSIGDNAHIYSVAFGLALRKTGDSEK